LALGIGALLGWAAFFKSRELEQKLGRLEKEISLLRHQQYAGDQITPLENTKAPKPELHATDVDTPNKEEPSASTAQHPTRSITPPVTSEASENTPVASPATEQKTEDTINIDANKSGWWQQIQNNWMIWLGGACVGLSGVFLVKYSVEQGLLGPTARIICGLIIGVALHLGAEWLRRNLQPHPSFAALAGGGSITLFATLLSALQMYQLIAPGLAFAMMALVAILTMWLARVHGPVLAGLGMLGAYIVPILVSSGTGSAISVLIYALIISAATLTLLRHVFRPWLWWGLLAGALGWWLLTFNAHDADSVRGLYLALLAYCMIAIASQQHAIDWFVSQRRPIDSTKWRFAITGQAPLEALLLPSLGLIIAAQALSIFSSGFSSALSAAGSSDTSSLTLLLQWSPLVVLLLIAARRREHLAPLPWLLFSLQLVAWLGSQTQADAGQWSLVPLTGENRYNAFGYLSVTAGLFSGLSLWALSSAQYRWRQLSMSLACMAPLLTLGVAYSLAEQWSVSWQWSLSSALLGSIYLSIAARILQKNAEDTSAVWLLLGGHLAFALAIAMSMREASLTLALALVVLSLCWVIQKFAMVQLGWLLKGLVALVILRLSLNPWLASYPVDIHWSLWTFGGATLCCAMGAWLLSNGTSHRIGNKKQTQRLGELSRWIGAAAMHLFVLTVWAETRYWLYDGDIFSARYDFLEAVINTTFFGALALVYYHRGLVSVQLQKIYQLGAFALMAMALTNFAVVLLATLNSIAWAVDSIGPQKVFNLLWLAYAAPALVALCAQRWFHPKTRQAAAAMCGIAGFIFISLQIRHLWQGNIDLQLPTSSGELYSYSIVWLVLAIGATLSGSWRNSHNTYRGGMLLLALVIGKLFLIDMSDLEGLLRVASFMGLGLALLGIAYLHKQLSVSNQTAAEHAPS